MYVLFFVPCTSTIKARLQVTGHKTRHKEGRLAALPQKSPLRATWQTQARGAGQLRHHHGRRRSFRSPQQRPRCRPCRSWCAECGQKPMPCCQQARRPPGCCRPLTSLLHQHSPHTRGRRTGPPSRGHRDEEEDWTADKQTKKLLKEEQKDERHTQTWRQPCRHAGGRSHSLSQSCVPPYQEVSQPKLFWCWPTGATQQASSFPMTPLGSRVITMSEDCCCCCCCCCCEGCRHQLASK